MIMILTVFRSSQNLLIVASQRDQIHQKYWGWSETICMLSFQLGERLATMGVFYGLEHHLSWSQLYRILGLSYCVVFGGFLWFFLKKLRKQGRHMGKDSSGNFLAHEPIGKLQYALESFWKQPYSIECLGILLLYRVPGHLWNPIKKNFWIEAQGLSQMFMVKAQWFLFLGSLLGGALAGISIRRWDFSKNLLWGTYCWLVLSVCMFCVYCISGACPTDSGRWFYYGVMTLEQALLYFAMIVFFSYQLFVVRQSYLVTQIALLTAMDYGWGVLVGSCAFRLIPLIGWGGVLIVSITLAAISMGFLKRCLRRCPEIF
jgi:hypothetical protein